MTIQITVRIPDDLVNFIDAEGEREGKSRAAMVSVALRHERRRRAAERDAAIYASTEPDSDVEDFLNWTSAHPARLEN